MLGPSEDGSTRLSLRRPAPVALRISQAAICAACPSRASGFCSRFDDATLARLAHRSSRVAVARREAAPRGDFRILVEGLLTGVHHDAEGRRRIVGLVLPGEAVAPGEEGATTELEAATPATLCRIHPVSYAQALRDSHAFRRRVYVQTRRKLDRAQRLACALAALHPDQRIAEFLAASVRFMPWRPLPGGGGLLRMALDRADVAALLGTTVETLCRVLRRFDDDGLIRLRDARRLEIPDPDRLRARGGMTAPVVRPRPAAERRAT